MSPEQQASRGDAAERLLKDELLNEAFNVLEQEYTNLRTIKRCFILKLN